MFKQKIMKYLIVLYYTSNLLFTYLHGQLFVICFTFATVIDDNAFDTMSIANL